jgi:superfamily I DNA/RNA helicase
VNKWDEIRRLARRFHAEVCAFGDEKHPIGAPADVLLAKAEKMTGVKRKSLLPDHPLLDGADAKLERNRILFNSTLERWIALYYQAHEYAHLRLNHGTRSCASSDIDVGASEDKVPLGVNRVEGYGTHERLECEANVFAREFLLPSGVLRQWFVDEGLNADDIAIKVGVSIEMVCHQLAHSLLTPDISDLREERESRPDDFDLDESQRDAAHSPVGPLLIEAGPGTGKTRALVGRILYLLSQGVAPENILVLTFSNKAADELRERVGAAAPDAAQRIRMETFHSFGLDLLRKYGTEIGLPTDPKILDPIDALFLLERALPELALDHYKNLYEPTIYLQDILKAISRAKDEHVSPARYTELAQEMSAKAASPDEETAAEKALEVARVYTFYQEHLECKGLLDFGDLIARSITLLREHENVKRDVQQTYRHVLVDEYQDVNRASGLLLREVAGDGRGLWAVGDVRQAIHRWRGASPANMRLFSKDFPTAKEPLRLERNYRSQPAIVDTFAELVPQMSVTRGADFTPWEKDRADVGGKVQFEIAEDLEAEARGIAREIKRQHANGVPYRRQAVICRSHTNLARIAHYLEKEDVPILYLGDLFERPEVRDMLSLLALACEGNGSSLIRVARFPEYQIPLADVLALRALARARSIPFPQALSLAVEAETVTPRGKERLALLARHIDGLCHGRSAWKMLVRYLFATSGYLSPLLSDNSVADQQRRLALYQFLQFVHSQLDRPKEEGVDPKLSLLKYIRRLEIFGEEKQLRQVPTWADNIDAVRIFTIHASKGLEFSAVYLPVLSTSYFPAGKQYQPCPPPDGLLADGSGDWQQEEEECLFFVALSRARDHLCLSRAKRYGRVNRNPSKFLPVIARKLPRAIDGPATWSRTTPATKVLVNQRSGGDPRTLPVFHEQHLDVYMKCPRKYFYEFVLELGGRREDSVYVQFHQCVYDVLRWLQHERAEGHNVDESAARAYLAEIWKARGPLDHFYEPIYRSEAELMVVRAVNRPPLPNSKSARLECEIALPHGRVKLTLDHTELVEDGSDPFLLVQRIRTGRPSKSEADKPIYGLYHAAAEQEYPKARRQLQILYLSTNEVKDSELKKKQVETRLTNYDDAIVGILNEQFDPEPSDRECPRCPHYFICPLAEDIYIFE